MAIWLRSGIRNRTSVGLLLMGDVVAPSNEKVARKSSQTLRMTSRRGHKDELHPSHGTTQRFDDRRRPLHVIPMGALAT
ncbi:MAG: hypothetical protein WBD40_08730, partial [Tepidisphaeraceae bacterium]